MHRLAKLFLALVCVSCAVLALICQSWAISLSFNPSPSMINIGDTVDINIDISGLENDNLGSFSFDINYDNSILSFNSYTLGNGLGDILSGDADDWSFGDLGGGTINLAELSCLWDLSTQSDAFTLATLSFRGSSAGNTLLSFSNVTLGDDWGDPLFADLGNGSVTVNSIPEPSTLLLLVFSMVGVVGIKKKFS